MVHSEISIQIGFCEMMRLAQTSKSLMSSVCSRAVEINFTLSNGKCLVPRNRVAALVRRCAGLRRVRLAGRRYCDEVILALCAYCTSLRSLELGPGASDSAIATVARVHTGIVELTFKGTKPLTDDALRSIAQHLPKLQVLNLEAETKRITDAGVIELIQVCTSLKRISLMNLPGIGTDRVNAVISAIAQNCRLLEDLDLWHYRNRSESSSVDTQHDEAVAALARGCPLLRRLRLGFSPITDAALIALADCPIRDLFLMHCPNVTDAVVAAFLPTWKSLPHVCLLFFDTAVTTASVLGIAAQVPNLISLTLSGGELKLEHYDALLRGCSSLMELKTPYGDPNHYRRLVQVAGWRGPAFGRLGRARAFQRALPHFGDHKKLRKILDSYELKY